MILGSILTRSRWSFPGRVLVVATAVMAPLPAEAHAPGVVLSAFGTAKIDGVWSSGEWDRAGCVDLAVNVPEGGTTPGKVCAMNDDTNLYLTIRFRRTSVDGNSAAFEFDNNHSGPSAGREDGDDVLIISPGLGFFDEVRTTKPPCPPGGLCGFFDSDVGGTNDGAGAFSNDGLFTVYEFSHPLDSADNANDFSLRPGSTVGFSVSIRIIAAGVIADTDFLAGLNGDIVIASPPPVLNLALTGCTFCRAGDTFSVAAAVRNPGSKPVRVEMKAGVVLPDGTEVNLWNAGNKHFEASLAPGVDTVSEILRMTVPGGLPKGTWFYEGALLSLELGRTLSRDVRTFTVQ